MTSSPADLSALDRARPEYRDAAALFIGVLEARRDRDWRKLNRAVRRLRKHGISVVLIQPDPAPKATNRKEVAR